MKNFKIRKNITLFITVVFVLSMTFIYVNPSTVNASEVTITKKLPTGASETYAPGETITYIIDYRYASIDSTGSGIQIIDTLPDNMELISASGSTHISSFDANTTTDVATFTFIDPLPAGVTGFVTVLAKFKDGSVSDGDAGVNTAVINGTGLDEHSSSVTVNADVHDDDWSVNKIRTFPNTSTNPVPGTEVKYRLTVNGNTTGGRNLVNVVLEDRLPEHVTIIDADGATLTDNVLSWTIGDVAVGASVSKNITIIYDADFWSAGTTATNWVYANGTPFDDTVPLGEISKSLTTDLSAADPKVNVNKIGRENNDQYSFGQDALFNINTISNTGNVPLENFTMIDEIPIEFWLTSVTSGRYVNTDSATITLSYFTNLTTEWQTWGSNDITVNTPYEVPVLTSGEYITKVKWEFGTALVGFADNGNAYIYGKVKATDKAGHTVTPSDLIPEVTNIVTLSGAFSDVAYTDSDSSTIDIVEEMPRFDPVKSIVGANHIKPNDNMSFSLSVKNHAFATGSLTSPIVIDVLPLQVEYIADSWSWDHGNTTYDETLIPTFTIVTDSSQQILKWDFSGLGIELEPGEFLNVHFDVKAKIPENALVGEYINTFYMTTNVDPTISDRSKNIASDTNDLDQDSSTDDMISKHDLPFYIDFEGQLESNKWVKSTIDGDWGNYLTDDGIGESLPGGIADYQLVVVNPASNGPIRNVVMIDILPYVGDSGVLVTNARLSEWSPYLINEIVVTDKLGDTIPATIYYSIENYHTSNAFTLEEIEDELLISGSAGSGWTTTIPTDITSVKAIKIDLGNYEMNPSDEITAAWPMRAPLNAPTGVVAWNSFAFGARYPYYSDGNVTYESFSSTEPIKVGYEIVEDLANKYTIGDFIWYDLNANGIQDSGEVGINGVLVNLYRADQVITSEEPIAYTRTGTEYNNEEGYYGFPNLPVGDYIVEFIYSDEYTLSPQFSGGDVTKDSNGDTATYNASYGSGLSKINSTIITVTENDLSIDLGLYKPATLGNFIFYDENGNGIQDSGEDGIENVLVTLTDVNGNIIDTTLTDADGLYQFADLVPAIYKVVVSNPDSNVYVVSPTSRGANTSKDSDFDIDTLTTGEVTLISGQSNQTIDGGFYEPASIGDTIWIDTNGNGIKDGGESGMAGVTVVLQNQDGDSVYDRLGNALFMDTDENGGYLFENLPAGDYIVFVNKPDGYAFTSRISGSDTSVDSNIFTETGKSEIISLVAGEHNMSVDGGLNQLASIGDIVWCDKNENGIQDDGEVGVSSVVVQLLNSEGDVIMTDTTDQNGKYLFENIAPGSYTVKFIKQEHFYFTLKDQLSNDLVDSDATNETGLSDLITVLSGEHNLSIDVGIILEKASVGDYIWFDKNLNGLQDNYEDGVEGVTVKLYNSSHELLGTSVTIEDGLYQFTQLVPGDYYVEFDLPNSYIYTTLNAGEDDLIDSDVDLTTNSQTDIFALTPKQYDSTHDVGLIKLNTIGDFVFRDNNRDGLQGENEVGVSNVSVNLYNDADEFVASTTTDTNGMYLFTDLPPGSYYIEVIKPGGYIYSPANIGENDEADSDIDTETGYSHVVTVVTDDHITSLDSGLILTYIAPQPVGSIGDTIWLDANKDGLFDEEEVGVAGITVKLKNLTGNVIKETLTDQSGRYLFNNLIPSLYSVVLELPSMYEMTIQDVGEVDELDSDFDIITFETNRINLKAGEHNMTIDGGLISDVIAPPSPSIPPVITPTPTPTNPIIPYYGVVGDHIWMDDNLNGLQDEGETGVNGIVVKLIDQNTNQVISETTTETNSAGLDGYYLFLQVESGRTYYITVTTTDNYAITLVNQANNDNLDSDVYYDGEVYLTESFTFTGDDLSFDIGLVDLELVPDWEVPRAPAPNPQTGNNHLNYLLLFFLFLSSTLLLIVIRKKSLKE